MGIELVILGLNIESELDKGWTCSKVESLQCFKWVCNFLSHDISSHEAFSLHPDHNHNLNPYPNPDSAVTVTGRLIKGREMNCLEMN